jgi:hypothetical protein
MNEDVPLHVSAGEDDASEASATRESRSSTPPHAVESFVGTVNHVRADVVHRRLCIRPCVNFFVVASVVIIALLVSIVMVAHFGLDDETGRWFAALGTFSFGVLVPNPKYPVAGAQDDE